VIDVLLLFVSGLSLALHFGFWLLSLDHTSISHSLLLVSSSPLIIVVTLWGKRIGITVMARVRGRQIDGSRVVTWKETGATMIGVCGAVMLILDVVLHTQTNGGGEGGEGQKNGTEEEEEGGRASHLPTLQGDLMAFGGAVAVVVYIFIGGYLRSRRAMPLFVYAFPVTFISALLMSLACAVLDSTSFWQSINFWHVPTLWLVAYLSFGPGLLGHTGINAVLKYLPPLVIGISMQAEPLVGTAIGAIAGLSSLAATGPLTWVGAVVLLTGTILTTVAANRREKRNMSG